jgi:flagellar assembly protein FliH
LREEADAAFKRGHREGESAARASCRREVEEASRQMALAVHNALGEKARLRTEAEVDVVRLSLAIARKILHREVRIDPGVALGLVKAAMETVGSREIQVIRTTPALAAALRNGLAATGVPEGVTVVEDASLESGGLVVQTSRGEVDASLEAQFEEISRGLLQAAGEAGRRG